MATDTLPAEEVTTEAPVTEIPAAETAKEEAPKAFDPNSLPAEAKAHFDKQYEGYGRYKEMASEYETLLKTNEFREWYQGQRQAPAKQPQKFEVSDEQFVGALSNKDQFTSLVNSLAEKLVNEKIGPQLQQAQMQAQLANKTNELDKVMGKYPDFMDLDKRGFIEPVLRKYPGISYEDAYWLGKRHTINEDIDKRARGLVESKKAASVEKPGPASGQRSHRVKAKTSLEAMEIAAEAYKAGREIPDFDFEK